MFLQIDSYAARNGLVGLPREELPRFRIELAAGWIFLVPIAVLLYFMFWEGTRVEKTAIYATAVMLLLGALRRRGFDWRGVIAVAENGGVLAMLLLTGLIAILLGMGLPTSAVYVLLSVVLGPALVKMGLEPLAAHMFIFYLGMMSFLTPPVAMSSYTAAGIAGADLWTTSTDAIRTGASGYLLPFIFALNPALILHGTWTEIFYATTTVLLSGAYLSWAAEGSVGATVLTRAERLLALVLALAIGSSTLWLGAAAHTNLAVLAAGAALALALRKFAAARRSVPA
jgi:TRAP-type uncharacterized transport system fused permease subunit